MAGIYIHIPFCVTRCTYCDFFSNTDMRFKTTYPEAIIRELELRKDYLRGEPVDTIYFGGGTPSQLAPADFEKIFEKLNQLYDLSACREITLEANPDDMTSEYVEALTHFPFNRSSMGGQSFDAADLKFLNRRHTAAQARQAVELCKAHGLNNISLDLIYGLPGQTPESWQKNLDEVIALDIPHISAYHLIYEQNTKLYRLLKAGKINPVSEETSVELFEQLIGSLKKAGYEHYEISNFARPGMYSKHNSSYWKAVPYLGIGPSAHSYNGLSRQWNISSLPKYLKSLASGKPHAEIEELDEVMRYNDYIITGLRTQWGVDLAEISRLFGNERADYCIKLARPYLEQELLRLDKLNLSLTEKGVLVSDGIMSDLLYVSE